MAGALVIDKIIDLIVLDESGCWLPTSRPTAQGYTAIRFQGKMRLAHRLTYEAFREPIPEELQIDHLCRVRACVNPWHMETVTVRENFVRGEAPNAVLHRTNVCKRGHPLDSAYVNRRGNRNCRICTSLRAKARRAARREAVPATRERGG